MDREQLELKLKPFCEAAKKADKPVVIEGTSMAYPGVSDTSFTVHVKALDWANKLSCAEMLDHLIPILWDSTDQETRRFMFALNIYNKNEIMNCHHPMSYKEYEMAC
jgi:hypothetical protein